MLRNSAFTKIFLVTSALAACAAPRAEDDAQSGAAATARGPRPKSAEIRVDEKQMTVDGCSVLLVRPIVATAERAVDVRIAAEIETALPKAAPKEVCADRPPATSKIFSQRFFDTANARGILSLSLSETQSVIPDLQPPGQHAHLHTRVVGRTFELASGRSLSLREVFTAQGLERIRTACLEANPVTDLSPEAAARVFEGCNEAVSTNRAGFTIDDEDVNVLVAIAGVHDRFVSWESFRSGDLAASPVSEWLLQRPLH